ncbi:MULTISPECIES: hypothetical protein [unclassified Streptomyces]|uniref:hypothetical protein n=1 Tax=unclassified Streptomyces TaxID=2593676 RepID=UPI000F6C225A|nr:MULTISPECIES: hypothetical protein [unclassified Streptomyces]AZM63419.1 hypothetical protein DLM49_31070 [Streptomyces sp. WAC 01438]RSN00863.1 hypothetical protein DMA10_04485 [Streptomyces sp. WAC 01420]
MGTAERSEAPEDGATAQVTARPDAGTPGRGTPAGEGTAAAGGRPAREGGAGTAERGAEEPGRAREQVRYRPLWVEEPARRRRLPDPVRTAAVRAVLVAAVTLIQAMVALLCTLAGSWLAFPMVISSVVSTILATWAALDVWVTRQVWNQRNGVVSVPSSTARALRRERRRARRQERSAQRARTRIGRGGGAGQLSHP